MNPPDENDRAAFTPADVNAWRWLALVFGVVTAIECLIVPGTEMLVLAIGLSVVTMVLCPLAIYFLRRRKTKR